MATLRYGPDNVDQCIGFDEPDVYERLGRRAALSLPRFPERIPEDRRAAVLRALEEGRFAAAAQLHYRDNPAIDFTIACVEIPDIDPFALEDLMREVNTAGDPPRMLTSEERTHLIAEADRLAEGSLQAEQLLELSDGDLLRAWQSAMWSYVQSNMI